MNLDEQVRFLIDGALDVESSMSVAAIAPVLKQAAQKLGHPSYYICQSPTGDWAVSTLRHRQHSDLEIKVIYAFDSVKGIEKFYEGQSDAEIALEIPVINLLFEVLSVSVIDRVIFYDRGTNFDRGQEILMSDIKKSIVQHLEQLQAPAKLPPDIC
jgi:hypothetical protein